MINDILRILAQLLVPFTAWYASSNIRSEIRRYRWTQSGLRERYGLSDATPIRGYDDVIRARIDVILGTEPGAQVMTTSGTTDNPKRICMTPARMSAWRAVSRSVGARVFHNFRIHRAGTFVMASLNTDASFTSLVLPRCSEIPPRMEGVMQPARFLSHPSLRDPIKLYGLTGVRLWLMVLSDPGLIYATNPSTLAVFLGDLYDEWEVHTAFIRDYVQGKPDASTPEIQQVVERVWTDGSSERLMAIATSVHTPIAMHQIVPGLRAFCCWDGGYTRSFVKQIRRFLPRERYAMVPMFSLSTETIQTLPVFKDGKMHFLPLAPEVLYEFLSLDTEAKPENLLKPQQLQVGETYNMVVSDAYGLLRYKTDDLFQCKSMVDDLPDLRFIRRDGVNYSFTGEKLTGEQLTLAYEVLRREFPTITKAGLHLTSFPWMPEGARVPGYRLVVTHPKLTEPLGLHPGTLSTVLDDVLCQMNSEYLAKRSSARLAPIQCVLMPFEKLAEALSGGLDDPENRVNRTWESQHKILPLYRRRWETVFDANDDGPASIHETPNTNTRTTQQRSAAQ